MNKLLEQIGKEIVNLAFLGVVFGGIAFMFFIAVTDMNNKTRVLEACIAAGNQVVAGDCVK